MFCLPKQLTEKIKSAFASGELNPEKMNEMTSQQRREALTKIIGEGDAQQVNLLFEKKLLLKNQERAMYDWARDVTGLSKEAKAETLEKIRKTFADKNRRLYDPKENEIFLNEITSDIYSKKYKADVSLEEAQTITELANEAQKAKEKMATDLTWKSKEDGLNYGAAKVALDNYVIDLKLKANQKELVNPLKEQGIVTKAKSIVENAKISANFIAENGRAIVASLDNSFFGRQGLRVLLDPRTTKIWGNNFVKSWVDIYKTIKGGTKAGDAIIDAVKADAYSRKNYLNGKYDGKAGSGSAGTKLDIGTGEEAFPTSLPSKVPVLGRLFKASEVAYEAGAMRLRMDIADKVYAMVEKTGVDVKDNKIIGDLNEVINGMTGRGTFGKRAGSFEKEANKMFFSVKFFKSNLDYLTVHQGRLSGPASKLAATNLLYTAAVTGVFLGIAQALNPSDNKDIFNPTSSNFGKIRIGSMTIDLTHGSSGILVAITKIITQSSTNATTGIKTKLGEDYGSQTGMDVLWNFTENKFSPMFSVLKDIVKQETFSGEKPTILTEAKSLAVPIMLQNAYQLKDEPAAKKILGLIADGLGFNTNVYKPKTDWGQNTSKELQQFKEKVGEEEFKKANDLYDQMYRDWLDSLRENKRYQSLSDELKKNVITNKKTEIKNTIFKSYGFKYKSVKKEIVPKF